MATSDAMLNDRFGALQRLKATLAQLASVKTGYLSPALKQQVARDKAAMDAALRDMTGTLMQKPRLTYLRSLAMHRAAYKMVATKGLWKIGESHVDDIRHRLPEDEAPPNYNLLTQEQFNRLLE